MIVVLRDAWVDLIPPIKVIEQPAIELVFAQGFLGVPIDDRT